MKFSKYSKPSKYNFLIKFVLPTMIVTVIGGVVIVKAWYQSNLSAVDPTSSQTIEFKIEFGESVTEIASALSDAGIIKNATAFTWYVKGEEAGISLQAGNYSLSPSMSVPVIVELLSQGKINANLLTILSGKRLDEVTGMLQDAGWSEVDILKALMVSNYDHPLTNQLPNKSTLEGYIYPDSYEINDNTTPEDVIRAALDNFYAKITERDLENKLSARGFTLHEAVTLASIIEEEGSEIEDKRQIAQVFIKRLNEGIMLGADATFFYAAATTGQEPTVNLDSPYNTRINKGLPPGPIANFTISSLEAVANPASGDYLYFVAGDDGEVYYAKTLDEHNANADKYCIELCKLP